MAIAPSSPSVYKAVASRVGSGLSTTGPIKPIPTATGPAPIKPIPAATGAAPVGPIPAAPNPGHIHSPGGYAPGAARPSLGGQPPIHHAYLRVPQTPIQQAVARMKVKRLGP